MSQRNTAISVTFNDNNGAVGWSYNPACAPDMYRHWMIFGKWRTRWVLLKRFWRALILFESHVASGNKITPNRWVFNPEIPE